MWDKEYRDYKRDEPLVKQPVEPGKGVVGCEMHEIMGWGNTLQHPLPKKRGWLARIFLRKKDGQP